MVSKLILIGGGGHCHACIDVIESTNRYEIIGIIDTKEKQNQLVLGYPIIGNDNDLALLVQRNIWFLITIGHISTPNPRQKLFEKLCSLGANIATIISPYALISRHSTVGLGTIIMHKAVISAGSVIGDNSIINTNADIEHDSIIRNHVHVSTHAVVNGNCLIDDGVFIGSNSTLLQGVCITKNTVIGAGSVVTKDVNNSGVYYGNPAKSRNE